MYKGVNIFLYHGTKGTARPIEGGDPGLIADLSKDLNVFTYISITNELTHLYIYKYTDILLVINN